MFSFCLVMNQDAKTLLQTATADVLKTFLVWTLDQHRGVKAASSLNNYWRVLKMIALDETGHRMEESIVRDVNNVRIL